MNTLPVRAKALKLLAIFKAFALTGRLADCHYYPGRCPGLGASALSGRAAYRSFGTFQPYRSKLFDFIIYILSFFLIFISQRAEMLIRDLLMGFSHHVFFWQIELLMEKSDLSRLFTLFSALESFSFFWDVYLYISLLSVVLHIYACRFLDVVK